MMNQFIQSRRERVTSARADIDAKLNELSILVLGLKHERNNFADTAPLPPEILVQIFLIFARDAYETLLPPSSLLLLSHICHHWRMVVLNCQKYWSFTPIGFTKIPYPSEIAKRSGDVPLKVWMIVNSSLLDRGEYDPLENVFPRLRSLRISTDDTLDQDLDSSKLSSILRHPAPLLVAAEISSPSHMEPFILRDDLFAGSFPHLTRLSLSNFYFNWSAPYLSPNLTSLSLRGGIGLFCDQIYEVVGRMPLLQELVLEEYGIQLYWDDIFSQQLITSPRSIRVDHLRVLCLTTLTSPVANLCNALKILPHTKMKLCCQSPPPTYPLHEMTQPVPGFKCFLDWLVLHHEVLRTSGLSFRCLRISPCIEKHTTVDDVVLQFWTSAYPSRGWDHITSTEPHLDLKLSVSHWDAAELIPDQIPQILPFLPLSGVEALHLDHLPSIPSIARGLVGLANVRFLRLSGRHSFQVLEALRHPHSEGFAKGANGLGRPEAANDSPAQPTNILLPVLHAITFHDINFRGFTTVLGLLRARRRQGYPITELHFQDCSGLSHYWIHELASLCPAGKVEWDETCVLDDF